ncbi:MAG TPA: hypothetical protein VLU25_21425 [Acidobacteriota bacterium]|nr:hypothetical protein [Acidobacteriota bacterium]
MESSRGAAGNGSVPVKVIVEGRSQVLDRAGAYREFKKKGYIVFERALDPELVGRMYQVWEEYFGPFQAEKPDLKRLLMHLPFKEPLYHPQFLENPHVMAITDRVLGKKCLCGYFGSETALPGCDFMQWHFDLMFLTKMTWLNGPLSFANKLLGSLGYIYGIQVSVPLVDSHEKNAPFEIEPATNRFSLKKRPHETILMPAGSLIVRDIRNMHRGTPHRGDSPRPFLSLVYLRSWVPKWKMPEIPEEVYQALPEKSKSLLREANIGQSVPSPGEWAKRPR